MRIGILGTGAVGTTLGSAFVELGHEVMLGARSATNEKAAAWAAGAGARARTGTFADAAEYGELVVLATLGAANEAALRAAGLEKLSGKVVIDTTNPLDFTGKLPSLIPSERSAGQQVQQLVPKARVVKAFSTIGSMHMVRPGFPGGPLAMFICGDDEPAKQAVSAILADFGWKALDIGGIEAAGYLEGLALVWIRTGILSGQWNHALSLVRR